MQNKKYIAELYHLYEDKMQSYIITKEVSKVRRKIIDKIDEMNKDLTNMQKDLLQQILELEHEREALDIKETFIYGFTLAIKLFLNGLGYKENGDESCK